MLNTGRSLYKAFNTGVEWLEIQEIKYQLCVHTGVGSGGGGGGGGKGGMCPPPHFFHWGGGGNGMFVPPHF